jgi:hypothetical protein
LEKLPGHFPSHRPIATVPWPNPACETPVRYRFHATIVASWAPPVGALSPNPPPLLRARVATPVKLLLLNRPLITTSALQCRHLCARALEPPRHRARSVASCRHCRLRSALLLAAPPGCWCQPLNDDALEQHAPLAELLVSESVLSRPLHSAALARAHS